MTLEGSLDLEIGEIQKNSKGKSECSNSFNTPNPKDLNVLNSNN